GLLGHERQDAHAELLQVLAPHDHRDRLADALPELLRILRRAEAELDRDEDGFGAHRGMVPGPDPAPSARAPEALGRGARPLRPRTWLRRAQPRVVPGEDADDLLVGDGWNALHADVVVRDERDVRVADLELAGEHGLRVLGHVDHLPAGGGEPRRLGPGREARALDHDDRAAVVDGDA